MIFNIMITAQEAKSNFDKTLNKEKFDDIEKIYELIEESSNNGEDFLLFFQDVTNDIKKELVENDFKVFTFKNRAIIIYWGE